MIEKAIIPGDSGLEKLQELPTFGEYKRIMSPLLGVQIQHGKQERIFISGQISGQTFDDVMDKFTLASVKLIDLGYETVNPLHIEGFCE
jgi:hypothetical protein